MITKMLWSINNKKKIVVTGAGFLDDVKLGSARQGNGGPHEALHVEQCECPDG